MSNFNQNRPRMVLRIFALLLLVSGLSACIPKPQQNANKQSSVRTYGDGFPVVKPFDLTKAGTTVTAEFELPDSSYKGHYQPVFVGFRTNTKKGGKSATPERWASWMKIVDYIEKQPIPIKVQLWRLEHGKYVPVVLHALHEDLSYRPGRHWYEPHPNPIFTRNKGAGMDNKALIEIGQLDYQNRVYRPLQIAHIIPAKPGRYRIQMQSMQDHPILNKMPEGIPPMHIDMIVSHHRIWTLPQ